MPPSSFKSSALRISGFVVLLLCAVWQMLLSYQEQKGFNEKFDKSQAPQSRNVKGLVHHARQKHMLEADLSGARLLLQQALRANPSYIPAWLSLAELNNDLGQKEKAYAILKYVDTLTEGLKRWRWEKALTAYQLGKVEMLPGELRYIVHELPGKDRNDALLLAFTLWAEPHELVEKIGRENIAHLLSHAVGKNLPQHALFFWREIETAGVQWQPKQALALIDMLLRVSEVREASKIWWKYFNPDKLLFNGDFSKPFLEQAFGWRTGKKQNFDLLFAKGSDGDAARAVHYRFKGWENLNFNHLYQIVPVESGRTYILTAELKSQKMTTDQRPFLEVSGYKCKAPVTNSTMVEPDQDWTQHQVVLQVPEECAAMVFRLRRKESNRIDNKLSGQMWLRNFVVAEMDTNSITENTPKQ